MYLLTSFAWDAFGCLINASKLSNGTILPRDSPDPTPRSGDVIHPLLWRGSGYETKAYDVRIECHPGKVHTLRRLTRRHV